jgi:cytochrome b561
VLIIATAIIGLTMEDIDVPTVYKLHKSLGLTVLLLVAARLIWRLLDRRPAYPSGMPKLQQWISSSAHGFLYVSMIAMPMSGWIMNSAGKRPLPLEWFGLFPVPAISGPNPDLRHLAHEVHEIGFYIAAALLAVHVLAALKHHFVDRDHTLSGMTPGVQPLPPKE